MELREYTRIVQKRLWMVLVIVFLCCTLTAFYTYYVAKPVYEASARLIVNKSTEFEGSSKIDPAAITTTLMLINTYKEVVHTPAVMNKVVEQNPNLGVTAKELMDIVNVEKVDETQIMQIRVQDTSYEKAANIVNAVSKVFQSQIPSIMKVDNVTVLTQADVKDVPGPIKPNKAVILLISFIGSLMLSLGFVFILDFLSDTVETEEELFKAAGLPTLGVIQSIPKSELTASKSSTTQNLTGGTTYASNQ